MLSEALSEKVYHWKLVKIFLFMKSPSDAGWCHEWCYRPQFLPSLAQATPTPPL